MGNVSNRKTDMGPPLRHSRDMASPLAVAHFAARVSDPEVSLLAGYHFPKGHHHMKLAIMTSLQKGVFTTAKKKLKF